MAQKGTRETANRITTSNPLHCLLQVEVLSKVGGKKKSHYVGGKKKNPTFNRWWVTENHVKLPLKNKI